MTADMLTLHEVADRLGVHYMTAYRYVRTGRLPATRDGAEWRVRVSDVERFITRQTRPGRPAGRRRHARSDLEQCLVAGDEAGAWAVVEGSLAAGASPAEVHLALLVPSLASIGTRWERGRLTVGDEHRATAVAQRLVGRLGPRFARRGRKRGTVVMGAVAGETHAMPGAILADLLRGRGFEVVDLGADTPAQSFVEAARNANRLVAVVVGAITSGQELVVKRTVATLHKAELGVPVLVGGPGITDEAQARAVGADGWTGHDGEYACAAVELVAARPPAA
jgi:MerR family transcriptional regulator, light-induced transcriptional regulator